MLEQLGFYTANFWVAGGTVGLFFATILLVYVGRRQIISLREENAKWRTIEACESYDRDPVLHECLKELYRYKFSSNPEIDAKKLKVCLATVLNYLDGIAIGVSQGLYDRNIVEDHLKDIINAHVGTHLASKEDAKKFGVDTGNYKHLIALHQELNKPNVTYKKGWFFRR